MRSSSNIPVVLVLAATLASCGGGDCLPEPGGDESSPTLMLTIFYRAADTGRLDTLTVAAPDSATRVDGFNADGLRVEYTATDREGMRRVQLGAALLTTVGVGIESRRFGVEPLTAACPKTWLRGNWTAPPGDPGRSVSLGLVAENWSGLRSSTETVTVRLR